jgi:hypothetical protein
MVTFLLSSLFRDWTAPFYPLASIPRQSLLPLHFSTEDIASVLVIITLPRPGEIKLPLSGRRPGETAERVTVAPGHVLLVRTESGPAASRDLGFPFLITVVVQWLIAVCSAVAPDGVTVHEPDGLLLFVGALAEQSLATALPNSVAAAPTAHDVTEADLTGLAVPEARAEDHEGDDAQDSRQGDVQGRALGYGRFGWFGGGAWGDDHGWALDPGHTRAYFKRGDAERNVDGVLVA